MAQEQVIARYYPTLDTVMTLNDLPEVLGFLQDGVNALFSKVHFRDLQYSKSPYGDRAYYSLDIVSKRRLDIEIPGADIFIVLNPEVDDSGISSFPITIQYDWPILAYIRSFDLEGFSFSPEGLYDLALQILKIPEGQVVANALNIFTQPDTSEITVIEQFVLDLNQHYGSTIPIPQNTNPIPELLVSMTDALGQPPGLSIYQTYILNNEDEQITKNKLNTFFKSLLPTDDVESYIRELILPKFSASLELSAAMEFPRHMLKPVDEVTLEVIPETVDENDEPTGYPRVSLLFGEALFYASTDGGIDYNLDLALTLSTPAQIGNTGVIINIERLKLDLSRTENIPEADADGRPADFMGVYAQEVSATLPRKWFNNENNTTLRIAGRNLLIGTGGVSGTIALEAVDGNPNNGLDYMNVNIGNWELGFNHFDITFKQNVIINSHIAGRLKIPRLKDGQGNDAEILINGHLYEDGDFNLTASEPDGFAPIQIPEVLNVHIQSVELGREDDNFYIGTSCEIEFTNPIMRKLFCDNLQRISIPRIRFYDNGKWEIVGDGNFLPTNISLCLGPIEMTVSNIHKGSYQGEHQGVLRQYEYWGFDGAISLDPLGLDARGNGVKYYYTVDDEEHGGSGDSFIHISTIEVNLVIPGTASPSSAAAIIKGSLSLPEPGVSPEYTGEISLDLPKARIAGSAAMRLAPRYPAFLIDAAIDLPAPIPIGPLGIYGFRGLLGFRYVAEKEAVGLVSGEDSWYDYYTYPPQGVHVSKFSGPERTADYELPISLGAGAVLGTSFDNGTAFSVRAMLLLSMPSLFLLDGKGSILSKRLGLDDNREPPFFAFFAWGDNSIEFGMGADFQVPDNGFILDLYAEAQMGFFFNYPSAWYVNFGTRDTPITAEVLTILRAQSYLMLSAQGIEAGARLDFELRKRFGPARVYIYAYLEMGGFISFERPQIGGYIAAGGVIDIDIWIIGVTLELDTIFSAEAAKPFLIYAEISLRACVKILFANVCKDFTVKLKWEKNKMVDRSPVPPLPFSTANGETNRTEELVKGIHMLTNEVFELDYLGVNISPPNSPGQINANAIIPLDTFIEFKVVKGLVPGAISSKIGGYTFPPEKHVDLIPPQRTTPDGHELRQVKHRYSIEDIEIRVWTGNSWRDYHPYEAVVHPDNRSEVEHFRIGYWQLKERQYDTIRLLATTPFTYMEAGEPGWTIPEQYGITPSTLYCSAEFRDEDCANVLDIPLGAQYYIPTQSLAHFIDGAYFVLAGQNGYNITDGVVTVILDDYMEVSNVSNNHNFERSLAFDNDNILVIRLPEPSVKTTLKLTTDAQGVTIDYYRAVINDAVSLVQYELIESTYKTATELSSVITYESNNHQISKIIVNPRSCDERQIEGIKIRLAQLEKEFYSKARGDVSRNSPVLSRDYLSLLRNLESSKARCCNSKGEPTCEKDDKLCDLYTMLKADLYACIEAIGIPGGAINSIPLEIDYRPYASCFAQFLGEIIKFDNECPEYELPNVLQPHFNDLESYPLGNDLATAVFLAELILAFIYELGNCDCDPKPRESCITSLQEVCWLTLEDHQWNQNIPGANALEEEHQDMIDAVQHSAQPIWRPNTAYYIKYTLKDEVDNGESDPGTYEYYYGFRTAGPLGHFHKHPNVNYLPDGVKEEEFTLTSLRSYIDYNRSYPNADGSLLRSKPLFYGHQQCRIDLFFNKPLTQHMLNNWHPYLGLPELDGALHIAIKDPISDVVIPYPLPADYNEETVPTIDESIPVWNADNHPQLPAHIQVINNMIENGEITCNIELGDPIVPESSYYMVTLTNLKPQKLYTALFYNAFEVSNANIVSEPVHSFVFQTSRYPDFRTQVESYLLADDEGATTQAVFDIPLNLDTASINAAYTLVEAGVGPVSDPWETQYLHLFDRATEGVLGMTPPDPPGTTEFNKIINSNTGEVVALLVRNPEPFNDPKIPLNIIDGSALPSLNPTIAVTFTNGNINGSYKVLYSKDYSQALIMHTSKKITTSTLNIRFGYLRWEQGNDYVEADSVLVGDLVINE